MPYNLELAMTVAGMKSYATNTYYTTECLCTECPHCTTVYS